MSENIKYVETLTPEKRQSIIKNSVMSMANSVVGNPTELKKAFVKPIVNDDGTPCIADIIDEIAVAINEHLNSIFTEIAASSTEIANIKVRYGRGIYVDLNEKNYVLSIGLLNDLGNIIPNSTKIIDLPLESVVVGGQFDEETSEIVLVLKNGNEIRFPVPNIVGGFISDKEFEDFLATKGQPNGFAGLDANGKVPKEQLPAGSGGGTSSGGISAEEFEELLVESLTNPTEEWTDEEKAAARKTIGAVGNTDLSEIYDILDLAGVTETIETTSTYDVRDTAQVGDSTLFVIPDTPTSVTKVEGNSAATDNMLNVYALQDTDYYRVIVEDMGEEIVFTGLITADTQLANIGKFSDLIPTAKIGDILYIYAGPTNAAFPAGIFYVGDGGTSWQANGSSPLTVTKEILDGLISVTFTLKKNTGMRVQNFCVAKHTLNRNNWTPFFTGLKSAAFNGITSSSKNLWNDSVNTWTKTSTTSTKTLYKSNWIEIPVGVKNLATSIDGAGIMMEIYGVKVGNTEYTLSGLSTGYSYVNLQNTGYYFEGITAVKLGVYLPTDTNIADIKTQIEIGDEVTEYVPYVSSKLLFPEIENPLGQTIDFENKKITDYGVELVLTGEEHFDYYGYHTTLGGVAYYYPSVYCEILPTVENRANVAVTTDGNIPQTEPEISKSNAVWIGVGGNKLLYWINILHLLRFDLAWVDKQNPTAEEQNQAIANFKAWLAQRYADGNPVTIRYISSELQSSRDMTAEELANLNFSDDGATYTPIENGIEYQDGNSNAVYGANNTVTQLYDMYRKLGGA